MSVLREILNNEESISKVKSQGTSNPLMDNFMSDEDSDEEDEEEDTNFKLRQYEEITNQNENYHEEEKENTFNQSYSAVSQQHQVNIQQLKKDFYERSK